MKWLKEVAYFNVRHSIMCFSILSVFFSGCVSREAIRIPVSPPLPHPELAKMRSLSVTKRDGVMHFGRSMRYRKRGITIVFLRGDPYEIGYARGVLLKEEIREWVGDTLYMLKKMALGMSIGQELMVRRSREVERFIPREYREELVGLSAGSGVDYETLLMMNALDTIGRQFGCTSVTVRDLDGEILRSRNLDYRDLALLKPLMLIIYRPDPGYAFVSVSSPGSIGVLTAMNEKGLTFGSHDISASSPTWRGIPSGILNRQIIQHADSVEKVGEILRNSPRCLPKMFMVTSSNNAGIYEFDSKEIGYKQMEGDHLILTNHTRVLNIGRESATSLARYEEAESFLARHQGSMDLMKLIELNRGSDISWAYNPNWHNLHSAIFRPATLDFWIAVDSPSATRGRWVGFNLHRELYGEGDEPEPQVIPAMGQ